MPATIKLGRFGIYGAERQNYIANRVREEVKSTKGGCLLIIGSKHITGAAHFKVLPLSQILTGKPFNRRRDTDMVDGLVTQVVPRDSIS